LGNSIALIRAMDSPEWNADVYGALSSLSRLAAAVRNRGTVIRLAYSLHTANRSLRSLFEKVEAAMSGSLKPDPGAEVPTPRRLLDSADKLLKLSRDIDYMYELLRRVGLTNNSLTAGNLARFQSYRAQIEDLADWFELMAQSDEVKAIFERGLRERERGEIFDLERA
jgi:hypothetical protein